MIECMKYKPVNKGSFLGYADFYLVKTGQEIYGCQLYQKDGHRWINLPSKEYTNELGEKKYSSIIRYRNPDHQKLFLEECMKAIEEKCKEMNDFPF